MVVRSAMAGQELMPKDSTTINYFEEAADVLDGQGHAVGEGYLEMTGYDRAIGRSF